MSSAFKKGISRRRSAQKSSAQRDTAPQSPADKSRINTSIKEIKKDSVKKNDSEKQRKKGGGLFASLFDIFKKKTLAKEDLVATEIKEDLKNELPLGLEKNNTPVNLDPKIQKEEVPEEEKKSEWKKSVEEIINLIESVKEEVVETEQPKQEEQIYKENSSYITGYNQEKENYTLETEDITESYHSSHKIIETPPMTELKEEPDHSITSKVASENTRQPEKEEEKKKKRGVFTPFLIVSLIANIVLALLLITKHQEVVKVVILKDKLMEEKQEVMNDLLKLKEEYSSLQTNNAGLQKELEEKRAEIENLILQVKKHKSDAYVISKLRKETETLRKIMKHFVVEIDSLNTLNKTIIAEKNKVVQDLNSQINKTTELEKDKNVLLQTVTKGSVLKAMSIKSEGIRIKGGVKEVEVKHATRVEKIKVAFTLSENPIAKRGTKTIYIHIMRPDGKEITVSESELNLISYNGTKGFFAEKKEIEYQNTEMPVNIVCGSPTGFIPGKYAIDIICEGTTIGQTELILK